jgi:hypothetical protein
MGQCRHVDQCYPRQQVIIAARIDEYGSKWLGTILYAAIW